MKEEPGVFWLALVPVVFAYGPAVALWAVHRWSGGRKLRFWAVTLAVVWVAVIAGFMFFVGDVLIVRTSEGVATHENPDIWFRLQLSWVFLLSLVAANGLGIWLGALGHRRAGR